MYKSGFIAVIGQPNAGKSTLMNTLVGEKVSIVSSKPQTTRKRVAGILTRDNYQIAFVDSPGVIQKAKGLNRFLKSEYEEVLKDCDGVLCLLNLDEKRKNKLESIIELVKNANKPWAAVITKNDLNFEHREWLLRNDIVDSSVPIISVSALKKPEVCCEMVEELCVNMLPESPGPLFDPQSYTTETIRDLVTERIREKCFEWTHQEVPFGLAVRLVQYEDEPKIVKIHAEILVNRESHKSIVIGKGGQKLKTIGTNARLDIEKIVGKKVYLELYVKSRLGWQENSQIMKELGYISPA